jgi:hypothetical protein
MTQQNSESEPKQKSPDGKSELLKGNKEEQEVPGPVSESKLLHSLRFEYAEGAD